MLRRHLPRVCPQLGGAQEHHLRQARHRALHRVRLQVRHRLHGHELRDGPAAVPARVDPARRDGSGRRVPRQLRPLDVGDRRLPVRDRSLDARLLPHRAEDGRGAGERPPAVGLPPERSRRSDLAPPGNARHDRTVRDPRAASR